MKNKAGVVVASVCFAAALMGLALSVGASSLAKAAGAEKLFSASEGVTLQRNFFIPDGTGDIKDPRSGLKVSASQAGKTIPPRPWREILSLISRWFPARRG